MVPSFSLTGKVAIVTGSSRGIGESIARTYAAAGAKVVLASRKPDGLQKVAADLDAKHGEGTAAAITANTGKEDDCKALVAAAIARFGHVDILVNNAAANPYFGPMMNVDMGAWDKTFDVNVRGYFWLSREIANHLLGRSAPGSIINVASVVGLMAAPLQGVYGMTKAAVLSMTRTLAAELGPSKIRVNAVAPGLVETKFASALTSNDEMAAFFTKRAPLGRWAQPEEIAGIALYLASDAASFTTGQTFTIDGGMTVA